MPSSPVSAPATVRSAVRLMIVRSGLGLLGLVILVATRDSVRRNLAAANPGYDHARLERALTDYVSVRIVFGLVFAVLYVLLALQVGKGRNWARIVTWIFAALAVAAFLAGLAQAVEVATRILGVILVSFDVVIVVQLLRSGRYFTGRAA